MTKATLLQRRFCHKQFAPEYIKAITIKQH